MQSTKPILKSQTVGGALLSIAGAVASYLELAGKLPLGGAGPIVSVLGSIFAIFGRVKATSVIQGIL